MEPGEGPHVDMTTHRRDLAIWGYAFGYFACYAPYSALTKALSRGALDGMTRGISALLGMPGAGRRELVGAALVMGAMLVLGLPTVLAARRAAKRAAGLPEAGTGAPGR
jgi:hypothetical protein